jgi:methionyl-tRNA formyltransferase
MAPRILVFGYSEVGTECLSFLLERGDRVVGLVTHEDDPGERIWFRTPAAVAREHGVPIFAPADVNTPDWIARVAALQPDLILSAYYRSLISPEILGRARLGGFNLHGSLLPKYRGRAPINWAVLHGETRVGLTLHRMVKRADAGAIVDQESFELGPRDTAGEAHQRILPGVRRILARQIEALLAGTARETPQDEAQATYFGRRTPEDGRIHWRQTSAQIFNLIRAVTEPYPGAFTDVKGGRLRVWWAEPETDAARGRNGAPGTVLSVSPLVIATADGALELTRTEWQDGRPVELHVGQVL